MAAGAGRRPAPPCSCFATTDPTATAPIEDGLPLPLLLLALLTSMMLIVPGHPPFPLLWVAVAMLWWRRGWRA